MIPVVPVHLQEMNRKGVEIGDSIWIGAGAIMLDGVNVGKCSYSAGPTVTHDVSAYVIVAGLPAQVIETRRVKWSEK